MLYIKFRIQVAVIRLSTIVCIRELEYGPVPNAMAALPNIGGALCSTPHSFVDAHY